MKQLYRPEDMMNVQLQVQVLLHWSDEQYAQYVYERGLEYLSAYLINDEEGQHILSAQPLYWGWWKNNFYARNVEFIQIADCWTVKERRDNYHLFNNPFDLVHEIRPGKNISRAAFGNGKINVEKQKV